MAYYDNLASVDGLLRRAVLFLIYGPIGIVVSERGYQVRGEISRPAGPGNVSRPLAGYISRSHDINHFGSDIQLGHNEVYLHTTCE